MGQFKREYFMYGLHIVITICDYGLTVMYLNEALTDIDMVLDVETREMGWQLYATGLGLQLIMLLSLFPRMWYKMKYIKSEKNQSQIRERGALWINLIWLLYAQILLESGSIATQVSLYNQIKPEVKRESTKNLYTAAMVLSFIEIFLTTIESLIEYNKSQFTQADFDDKVNACSGCFLLTAMGIFSSFLIFAYLPDDLAVRIKEEN